MPHAQGILGPAGGRGSWADRPPLPSARRSSMLVAAGNFLYCIGGIDRLGEVLPDILRIDATNPTSWTALAAPTVDGQNDQNNAPRSETWTGLAGAAAAYVPTQAAAAYPALDGKPAIVLYGGMNAQGAVSNRVYVIALEADGSIAGAYWSQTYWKHPDNANTNGAKAYVGGSAVVRESLQTAGIYEILISGGVNETGYNTALLYFSSANLVASRGNWTDTLAHSPQTTFPVGFAYGAATFAAGGDLVVAGGENFDGALSNVWKVGFNQNGGAETPTALANLPTPRSGATAFFKQGAVIIVGGVNGAFNPIAEVISHNGMSPRYGSRATKPTAVGYAAGAVAADGDFWVAGGAKVGEPSFDPSEGVEAFA